jgi:hypothetical protein
MLNKLPSPATILASLALFVSLSGTAIAAGAVPLAKKALFASNAGKLQGKTAAQLAAMPGPGTNLEGKSLDDVVAMPGPASTAVGLTTVATAPFSVAAGEVVDRTVSCPAGSRVLNGGWAANELMLDADSWPSSDTAWTVSIFNLSGSTGSGTLYAICLK